MLFFFFYNIFENKNSKLYMLSFNTKKNNLNSTLPFKQQFDILNINNSVIFLNKLILNELFLKFMSSNNKSTSLLKVLLANIHFNILNLNENTLNIKKNTKFLNKNILYKSFTKTPFLFYTIKQKYKLLTTNNFMKEGLSFKNKLNSKWAVNFANSSIDKYIYTYSIIYNILFLRKNKIFNKGRYSRNRQTYRTGVY